MTNDLEELRRIADSGGEHSDYGWLVTADGHEPVISRIGTAGPHDIPEELLRRLRAGEGRGWRTLIEDDGQPEDERVVHVGLYLDWYDMGVRDVPADLEFRPLADLSQPDCGAIEIQYLNDHGKWVTL